ncbi:MAG TPA: hypothetical protein VGJ48_14165 [Pyrinomonadaceae bacterium]
MELDGTEKRLQTLFRELKLADERIAPDFKGVWNRAQAPSSGPSRLFNISLAVATALVVLTLSSLVLWSQTWRESQPFNSGLAAGPARIDLLPPPPSAMPGLIHPGVVEPANRARSNRGNRKVVARRHPNLNARNADVRKADSISKWQSPTATLLQSPADNVLTSLPQLDRSVTELKTFLPNTPSYQNRER